MHELPPRDEAIVVIDGSQAAEAIEFLVSRGRIARLAGEDRHAADATHARAGRVTRLWQPNEFLMEVLPKLTPGTALDLGCGSGREAVALASEDWRVTAADLLPDALEKARDLQARYAPETNIDWLQIDLERQQLEGKYDLVTMFAYLNRPILQGIDKWLNTGGSFVIETFTSDHRAKFGKPSDAWEADDEPPPALDIQRYERGWRGERHTVRMWGILR